MQFVLDNSVTMRWLFGDGRKDGLAYADRVLQALAGADGAAVVPAIRALEVGNAVVRAEAQGLLSEARSAEFLGMLQQMPIEPDTHTAQHAWADTLQLARRHKLSSYDASYLELALRRGTPIATLDADLRRASVKAGVAQF
jgi:predicted nucleic acid-binding protein